MQTATRTQKLPPMLVPDVLFYIFALRGVLSPGDLYNAALVHSSWLGSARHWLYDSVDVVLPNKSFATTMWTCPPIRALVHRLDIRLCWPFQSQLCAAPIWVDRNEMIHSFTWLLLQGVEITHLSVDTGLHWAPAVAVIGLLEGSYFMGRLQHLKLRGMHLQFEIPLGLETLDLVGSSFMRYQRVAPPHLHSLRIIDVARLPLLFFEGISKTLTRLEIHLSALYRNLRGGDNPSWTWPDFPALQHLAVFSTRGENLYLGRLRPNTLALSVCLFETNQIPRSVTTVELHPPGILTYIGAQRFLLQKSAMRLKCVRVDVSCLINGEAVASLAEAGLEVNEYCMLHRPCPYLYH